MSLKQGDCENETVFMCASHNSLIQSLPGCAGSIIYLMEGVSATCCCTGYWCSSLCIFSVAKMLLIYLLSVRQLTGDLACNPGNRNIVPSNVLPLGNCPISPSVSMSK